MSLEIRVSQSENFETYEDERWLVLFGRDGSRFIGVNPMMVECFVTTLKAWAEREYLTVGEDVER